MTGKVLDQSLLSYDHELQLVERTRVLIQASAEEDRAPVLEGSGVREVWASLQIQSSSGVFHMVCWSVELLWSGTTGKHAMFIYGKEKKKKYPFLTHAMKINVTRRALVIVTPLVLLLMHVNRK